jgi:hypothetical protein
VLTFWLTGQQERQAAQHNTGAETVHQGKTELTVTAALSHRHFLAHTQWCSAQLGCHQMLQGLTCASVSTGIVASQEEAEKAVSSSKLGLLKPEMNWQPSGSRPTRLCGRLAGKYHTSPVRMWGAAGQQDGVRGRGRLSDVCLDQEDQR